MTCLPKVRLQTLLRGLCVIGLVLVLAGHLATLAYAYTHNDNSGQDGTQLVLGGAVLCSAIILTLLACLLPHKSVFLCRAWLAVHLTFSDDLAHSAVRVLYGLQVWPVVYVLGLAPAFEAVDNLDYWWWSLQGLLLVAMVGRLSRPGAEANSDGVGESENEYHGDCEDEGEGVTLTRVVVVVDDGCQQWATRPALSIAPPVCSITFHEN